MRVSHIIGLSLKTFAFKRSPAGLAVLQFQIYHSPPLLFPFITDRRTAITTKFKETKQINSALDSSSYPKLLIRKSTGSW